MAGRPIKGDYKLDTNLNLRTNAEIKEAFKELCKEHHMTPGELFNEYMQKCVEAKELLSNIR